jgi:hypothetical protein
MATSVAGMNAGARDVYLARSQYPDESSLDSVTAGPGVAVA